MYTPDNEPVIVPFEDILPQMPREALFGYVCNWLWEGPLEYTPDEKQTRRLIEIIQERPDAKHCDDSLKSCKEYLTVITKTPPQPTTARTCISGTIKPFGTVPV